METSHNTTIANLRSAIASIESRSSTDASQRDLTSTLEDPNQQDEISVCESSEDTQTRNPDNESLTVDAALKKILKFVSMREVSTAKLKQKLQERDFPEPVIYEAIEHAEAIGLVSNRRYAEALIRSRIASHKGLRPVLLEIEELDIDLFELDAYLEFLSLGEDGELDQALEFLQLHPPHSKNLRDGAFRKLINSGYSVSIASQAAGQWSKEQFSRP